MMFFGMHDSTYMSKADIFVTFWNILEVFCLSSNAQVHILDVTTPRDSYAWNSRELATLLPVSESLVEGGLEPLTIRSMRKNLTTELYWHLKYLMFARKKIV